MSDISPSLPLPFPIDRNNHIYNVSERAILDTFKAAYLSIPTKIARKHFFAQRIFREIHMYWEAKEKRRVRGDESKARANILAAWIYNNWRHPNSGTRLPRSVLHVRKSDVVWNTRKEEVFVEIARLLKVEVATTSTAGWFENRTVAIQNIQENMDGHEKDLLQTQVKHIEENGYPDHQKQIYAEKYCTRRMDASAKAHWLEMGVLSLSVIAYRRTDGKLVVEIHENASTLVGVTDRSFDEQHDGKAREIRRIWLDYVRAIFEEKSAGPGPLADANADANCTILHRSPEGFPLFSNSLDEDALDKMKKVELENLVRSYLRENYSLATRGQSSEVPYTQITTNAEERKKFIADEYLPSGFVIRDPHNMKVNELRCFVKFLLQRQKSSPPAYIFRFSGVKDSRKGSTLAKTYYPDEVDPENPPVIKKKPKRQRKKVPTNAVTTKTADAVNTKTDVGETGRTANTNTATQQEPTQIPNVIAEIPHARHAYAETEFSEPNAGAEGADFANIPTPIPNTEIPHNPNARPAYAETEFRQPNAGADFANNPLSGFDYADEFNPPRPSHEQQMPTQPWPEYQFPSLLSSLQEPLGFTPYGPGDEGMDYRFPLNSQNTLLQSGEPWVGQFPSMNLNFGNQPYGMPNQTPQITNTQFGDWVGTVDQSKMECHAPMSNANDDQFNFDSIQIPPSFTFQQGKELMQSRDSGPSLHPEQSNLGDPVPDVMPTERPPQNKNKRTHRTADDLAASEAVVIATKRPRVPKHRVS